MYHQVWGKDHRIPDILKRQVIWNFNMYCRTYYSEGRRLWTLGVWYGKTFCGLRLILSWELGPSSLSLTRDEVLKEFVTRYQQYEPKLFRLYYSDVQYKS